MGTRARWREGTCVRPRPPPDGYLISASYFCVESALLSCQNRHMGSAIQVMADPAGYDCIGWFYDRYWRTAYTRFLPALDRLVLSRLGKGSRILDLCCGTGQLAAALCRRGFFVTGWTGRWECSSMPRRAQCCPRRSPLPRRLLRMSIRVLLADDHGVVRKGLLCSSKEDHCLARVIRVDRKAEFRPDPRAVVEPEAAAVLIDNPPAQRESVS
jgi:hypothetical protein